MPAFALRLEIPFLMTGIPVDRANVFIRRIHRFTRAVSYVAAAFLVLVGVSLASNLLPAMV